MWTRSLETKKKSSLVSGATVAILLLSQLFVSAETNKLVRVPISVEASVTGFVRGQWQLSVNSAGRARLTIDKAGSKKSREFNVSEEQLLALAEVLKSESFFDLKPKYGELVPDGSTTVIEVRHGEKVKAVSIHFLMNWVHSAPEKLKEPARALKVFYVVRGWFDDKDAIDLKKYDEMVFKAAGRSSS